MVTGVAWWIASAAMTAKVDEVAMPALVVLAPGLLMRAAFELFLVTRGGHGSLTLGPEQLLLNTVFYGVMGLVWMSRRRSSSVEAPHAEAVQLANRKRSGGS
jgi:hypothetical protein